MRKRILRAEELKAYGKDEWYVELGETERIVNVVLVRPMALSKVELMDHSVAIIDTGWASS